MGLDHLNVRVMFYVSATIFFLININLPDLASLHQRLSDPHPDLDLVACEDCCNTLGQISWQKTKQNSN